MKYLVCKLNPTMHNETVVSQRKQQYLAPVAHLDRASDSGSEGKGFESPRAHH